MNKKGTNIFVLIFRSLSYVFLVFLFIIAMFLMFYILTSAIAKKTNTKPLISIYTIVSPSMEPTIMVYDVIVNTKINSDNDLNKGDIITFYSDAIDTGGYTVTHRVYKKYIYNDITYYETKGDNNNSQDVGRITFDNVVGKYLFKLPGLGKIQFFVSSKLGWIMIILIPASIIIVSDTVKLIKAYEIKKDLSKIKGKGPDPKKKKEKEKKIRALVEKADKINKK
jgi:signal peptidase